MEDAAKNWNAIRTLTWGERTEFDLAFSVGVDVAAVHVGAPAAGAALR